MPIYLSSQPNLKIKVKRSFLLLADLGLSVPGITELSPVDHAARVFSGDYRNTGLDQCFSNLKSAYESPRDLGKKQILP